MEHSKIYKGILSVMIMSIVLGSCDDNVQKDYYESGDLKAVYEVKDGKIDGSYKYFYKGGNLAELSNWVEGRRLGPYKLFYDNDQNSLMLSTSRDSTGGFHGPSLGYHESGSIKWKGEYLNDKRTGWLTVYNEDGSIKGFKEYLVSEGSEILNQWIVLDQDGGVCSIKCVS